MTMTQSLFIVFRIHEGVIPNFQTCAKKYIFIVFTIQSYKHIAHILKYHFHYRHCYWTSTDKKENIQDIQAFRIFIDCRKISVIQFRNKLHRFRHRPRTHGNVLLRFYIVYCSQGNREQPAHYLKQYKKTAKRFRVYGAIVTRDIVSGNAANLKATHDHAAIYVEEVHEGAHILWLINI